MTTRITLAILLTTWVVLIIGETAAFYTARQSLLELFDDNLITRAAGTLEIETVGAKGDASSMPDDDSYQIRNAAGELLSQSATDRHGGIQKELTMISFGKDAEGKTIRTVELRKYVPRDGKVVPYIITYSRRTEKLDRLLSYLAGMLLLISLTCGLATAWLSLKLSRAALRPLRETSDVIAQIDERQLSRRLDDKILPEELAPMARRLNEMLARLQDVFQQRKQFLADAAHELRTPTAALLTTLEVALRRPRDNAALIDALQSGLTDAQRLRRLVESLMQQARSEVQQPPPLVMTDIPAMIHECIQIIVPLASEKDVLISIDPATPQHLHFVTQPERLKSVVLNLISNAIEYNYTGGSITVSCTREPSNGPLHLTIKDTGIGISSEQLPQVFEPFFRGGTGGRGDDAQHLGLGLFLVKSHVEALRGQCKIESQPGKGTTMHITLPEPTAAEQAANNAALPPMKPVIAPAVPA